MECRGVRSDSRDQGGKPAVEEYLITAVGYLRLVDEAVGAVGWPVARASGEPFPVWGATG
jgi:hypothetical protein